MTDRKKLMDMICESVQTNSCVGNCNHPHCNTVQIVCDHLISKGVTIPVRCKDCCHGITDEEEPGMCKCVESAEYESESGLWLGFVEYHTPDFFCAYGERKDNGNRT